MENLEPKIITSIIVRPCYEKPGKVFRKENPRFIGELYVDGKLKYSSNDYDCKSSAYRKVLIKIQEDANILCGAGVIKV